VVDVRIYGQDIVQHIRIVASISSGVLGALALWTIASPDQML
jgi:hypothetical protein